MLFELPTAIKKFFDLPMCQASKQRITSCMGSNPGRGHRVMDLCIMNYALKYFYNDFNHILKFYPEFQNHLSKIFPQVNKKQNTEYLFNKFIVNGIIG